MASWGHMKSRITASMRTSNRMNALLSETMLVKRKALMKMSAIESGDDEAVNIENPKNDWEFFHRNFNMERVYKLIEATIEERLTWDCFSRSYDSWRSLQLAANLAADIRNGVRRFNYKRHRIICFLSVIEKQNQGITIRMRHLMEEKVDNFTTLVYERPTNYDFAPPGLHNIINYKRCITRQMSNEVCYFEVAKLE